MGISRPTEIVPALCQKAEKQRISKSTRKESAKKDGERFILDEIMMVVVVFCP